jgi:hypothetical protein
MAMMNAGARSVRQVVIEVLTAIGLVGVLVPGTTAHAGATLLQPARPLAYAIATAPAAGGLGAAAKAVSPIFRPLLPALARTQVPLKLPTVFPEAGTHRLYATLGTAKRGHYIIEIDYTADCHGANVCHYGDLEGRRAPGTGKPTGSPVQLGHHVTGYFVLGQCGASCAESTITWDSGRFRYTVGAKVSRADLITFVGPAVS